jgi:hypothetical protein
LGSQVVYLKESTMDSTSSELAELQEQLQNLEKVRKLLGDALTDQKKAELEARQQILLNTGGGAIIQGDVTASGDFVNRDKYEEHYHYHNGEGPATAPQAEAAYRQDLANHCDTLPLRGVVPREGSHSAWRRFTSPWIPNAARRRRSLPRRCNAPPKVN